MRVTVILFFVLVAGCVDDVGVTTHVPLADQPTFVVKVQPILAERCANPGCHGDTGRPLEVFAPRRHRLDPAQRYANAPLTTEELERNYANACGFLVGVADPDDSLLLRKCLPPALGGVHHEGGVIFEDTDEPDYQILRAWVASAFGEAR